MKDKVVKKSNKSFANSRNSESFYQHQFVDGEEEEEKQAENFIDTMRETKDYGTYKNAYDGLCTLTQIPKNSVLNIRDQIQNKHLVLNINIYKPGEKVILNPNDELYHTSNGNNISSLVPTFRSNDGTFYPSPRVYVSVGKAISKMGGTSDSSKPTYKLKSNPGFIFKDKELNGSAGYIETKNPIPVEKV